MGWRIPFFGRKRKYNAEAEYCEAEYCEAEYCEVGQESDSEAGPEAAEATVNQVIQQTNLPLPHYESSEITESSEYYWHKKLDTEYDNYVRYVVGTLKSTCGRFYLPSPNSPFRFSDIDGLHQGLLKLSLIDVPFFSEWGHKSLLKETCPNLRILEVDGAQLFSLTDNDLELPNELVILNLTNCALSYFEIKLPQTLRHISLEYNNLLKIPACIEATLFTRELKINLSGQS